jgi:mono/diheme cytochrome c family protein
MKRYMLPAVLAALTAAQLCHAEQTRAENGGEIFVRFCVKCHGEDGSGSRYGRLLKEPVRDLRTNRLFFSDNELFMIISNHGPSWREMPNLRYVLRAFNEEETKGVAGYVRTLKYAPDLKNGERLFNERCALCHASKGAAKSLWKAPDLAGSPLDAFETARAIRYGIHSTLMYPRETLHTNTEIADVVGYIQGLKK